MEISGNISLAKKPAALTELVRTLRSNDRQVTGELWIGFPILGDAEQQYQVDAIYLSKEFGIFVIDAVEGTILQGHAERQDDLIRLLTSKLLREKSLSRRGRLLVSIESLTYAPAVNDISENLEYVTNSNTLITTIENCGSTLTSDEFNIVKSSLQNLMSLRKPSRKRIVANPQSRGAKLANLEDTIATLDTTQFKSVIDTPEHVQRIRGLAGSGKTIVLALKAAYLHASHPEWKIAVTFNVRALREQFHRLITEFCISETQEEPNWDNLHIIHSWGSVRNTKTGIYAEFCKANDVEYFDYKTASATFGRERAFEGACAQALLDASASKTIYDAILVDEAQDFSPAFLRLCYEMLSSEKRLVYAYDELQKLSNESMASPEETFGTDAHGNPLVSFENLRDSDSTRDILLRSCYRNSGPVLTAAHAIGFGIYRQTPPSLSTGIVQIFDHKHLWQEIGYEVRSGTLADDQYVSLRRSDAASPVFLASHSSTDDLLSVKKFDSLEAQYQWVADDICKNLSEEELNYSDIMIINPDPVSARKNLGPLRALLKSRGIKTHIAGIDNAQDEFFSRSNDSITCTGIYRAKGNEAGMVYVVNAQEGQDQTYNLSLVRNRLFTAITRSKAWVRVTGVGDLMSPLAEEFNKIKESNFELSFRYPSREERRKLQILHRELAPSEVELIRESNSGIQSVLDNITHGNVKIEDIDRETLNRLRGLLDFDGIEQ